MSRPHDDQGRIAMPRSIATRNTTRWIRLRRALASTVSVALLVPAGLLALAPAAQAAEYTVDGGTYEATTIGNPVNNNYEMSLTRGTWNYTECRKAGENFLIAEHPTKTYTGGDMGGSGTCRIFASNKPLGIPVRVENLAGDEEGNESFTPHWARDLGNDCEDRNFTASGECALGIVELTGNVWDETLRFAYATDAEAESIDAIYFKDTDGTKLSGALTLATGVNDSYPKVHVRVPKELKPGTLEVSVEAGGYESLVGTVNRAGLNFDLKQDESLEVSENGIGVASYWCGPVTGSASSLRFDDIDFDNACGNYKNGTPGLALPYQVYQMEETAPDTFRFKPHCLGDSTAKWGNRSGPDASPTYGCVPPLETCSALGGKLSEYDNGYGQMFTYCDLSAEVVVSLSGPSGVAVGETVTYQVSLTSTDPIQAGTLSLVSKDAVVGTAQVPAGSASSLYSFTLTANVEQEVSSLEDLAYPLQAFYDVPHEWSKDERYESSFLVVNVTPNPEMCEALGKDTIVSARSLDIDGDGVPNARSLDVDGDGVPNFKDTDSDGDGVENDGDTDPVGPPARPTPPNFWTEEEQQELAWEIQEHLYGENYPSTFPLPVDPDSGEEETFADGAGVLVPAPSYEMVVEVLEYTANEACGIDTDWDGNGGGSTGPTLGNEPIVTPDPDPETDGGNGGGTPGGAYPILGDGGSSNGEAATGGAAPSLRLIMPSQAYQGVETDLAAEVDATDGTVEFAVQEIDLDGEQTARIIGSAPVNEDGVATIDVTPQEYGDAIVYARYTGRSGVDTTAGATVVYPAPFVDDFTLTVGGDRWTEMPKGEVLPYGYHAVEYTTDSGNAPQLEVDGPCQVRSTRSIPPQITMLGTAKAPKRCTVTVSTGGYDAYAPKSWTFDVANAMGNQTATLAADKAKRTTKKGSMVTLAKKTQTKTDEDYKLKGKKITWSVTSGKDVCSVTTSSSGKVSLEGKKKGTCTVTAKAKKVKGKYKGKYKAFNETYRFIVR